MFRTMSILILFALLSFVPATSPVVALSFQEQHLKNLAYVELSIGLVPPSLDGGHTEIEMGDVNGDGNLDLVSIGDHGSPYVNTDEHGIMVWFGDGTGHWEVYQSGDFGYGGIALGDVNNDGNLDAGYGMHHNYSGVDFGDQLLEVALGDGTGLIWTPWDDDLASNGEDWGMFGTDFADVDNDGDLDIGSISFGCCAGVHVYLNQGNGTWQQSFGFLDGNSDMQFNFGDINGDGNADFAVSHSYGTVYLGDGAGDFSLEQGNLPAPDSISSEALGDVNHDGRDELGFTNTSGGVKVWTWLSPGIWQNISGTLPNSGPYEAIQLVDMNMDGNLDAAAFGNRQMRIWAGDGSGGWTEIASLTTPSPGYEQAFRVGGDVDHNGYADIVLVSEEGSGWVYQNQMHFYKESSIPTSVEIKPIAPSVGKVFNAGAVTFVDWSGAVPVGDVGMVSLELSIHGPNGPWEPIAEELPNNGRYQWLISGETPATEEAYIRYSLTASGQTVQAVTSGAFTIIGSMEEPITGLMAVNDSPSILGETTTLTATIISGTNVLYSWDLGDGISATGAIIGHVYPEVGIFTATVTATNEISTDRAVTRVTVYDDPITGLVANNDSPTLLGETTILSATVTSGTHVTYEWDLGDGITTTGAVVNHIYPDSGVYIAWVTASNPVNTSRASTAVEVQALPPTWHYWLPLLRR